MVQSYSPAIHIRHTLNILLSPGNKKNVAEALPQMELYKDAILLRLCEFEIRLSCAYLLGRSLLRFGRACSWEMGLFGMTAKGRRLAESDSSDSYLTQITEMVLNTGTNE